MTDQRDDNPPTRWVACVGCGKELGLFLDGTRRVAHVKPKALIGVSNSVPCRLYRESSTEQLWALHRNAKSIEPPERFYPIPQCVACGRVADEKAREVLSVWATRNGVLLESVEWMCPTCSGVN